MKFLKICFWSFVSIKRVEAHYLLIVEDTISNILHRSFNRTINIYLFRTNMFETEVNCLEITVDENTS